MGWCPRAWGAGQVRHLAWALDCQGLHQKVPSQRPSEGGPSSTSGPLAERREALRLPGPQSPQSGAGYHRHRPQLVPFAPTWHSWALESRPHPPLLPAGEGAGVLGKGPAPGSCPAGWDREAGTMASFFSLSRRGWGNPRAGGWGARGDAESPSLAGSLPASTPTALARPGSTQPSQPPLDS